MNKPILFNTEMVKAILDGRKTVTRRIIKNVPDNVFIGKCSLGCGLFDKKTTFRVAEPKVKVGDILWVRETFGNYGDGTQILYKADFPNGAKQYMHNDGIHMCDIPKWKPSIHMPKSAARIFLKVTDVRVEKLQDITDEQCMKEGISEEKVTLNEDMFPNLQGCNAEIQNGSAEKSVFGNLWDSTVKDGNHFYSANPYVWVIEFERCEKPEDF